MNVLKCDDIPLTGRNQALIYLDILCLLTTGSAVAAEHGWRVFLPALQPCEVMECKHEKKWSVRSYSPQTGSVMVCATAGAETPFPERRASTGLSTF
jgi:hypothetical protein